jgi:hypothetical protein
MLTLSLVEKPTSWIGTPPRPFTAANSNMNSPVEQPTKFALVINLKMATRLGMTTGGLRRIAQPPKHLCAIKKKPPTRAQHR